MNFWLAATVALCTGLAPCALVCLRAKEPMDRLVAMEMGGILLCLSLVLLAEGMKRPLFLDVALTEALLSFGGALVFARFLERWV